MPLYQKQQCNQSNNFWTLSISTRWDPALHTTVNLPSYLNFSSFDSGNVSHHLQKLQHKELRRASLVAQMGKSLPTMWIPGFEPWVRKIPWRRKWKPTPVFLPTKVHEWRSLADYSPWGRRIGHNWMTFTYIHTYFPYEVASTGIQV